MDTLRYFIGALGVLFLGIFAGIMLEKFVFFEGKNPLLTENLSACPVPVVQLQKIENGILFGHVTGSQLRMSLGSADEISVFQEGDFSGNVTEILPNLKSIPAPDGMHFVAPKSGKYFYSLDHPKADTLSVKNRIFFATEEEALEKGYKKGT